MSDLISLASAYRNAEAERVAAFDDMEKAQAVVEAATARWEAAGNSAGKARKALLDCAASADTRPEGGDSTKIEAPFTGGAVGSEASETPKGWESQQLTDPGSTPSPTGEL